MIDLKLLCLLFGALFVTTVNSQSDSDSGPLGRVKFHDMYDCDPSANLIEFKGKFQEEIDGLDSLQISFDLAIDLVDEGALFSLRADKCDKDGNNCAKDFLNMVDKDMFDYVNRLFPDIFANMKSQCDPPIEEDDQIPAGAYGLDHFQADASEVNLSQVFYGFYKAELTVAQDDDVLICIKIDAEFFPPEE